MQYTIKSETLNADARNNQLAVVGQSMLDSLLSEPSALYV